MSVGLAGTKVLILVGAGAAGSVILNNPYLGDIFRDVARVIIRHLKDAGADGAGDAAPPSSDATAALTAQVRRLSQELRQLATMQSRPVVVTHGSDRGGTSLLPLLIPVSALGAAGYAYMWWKGLRWSDLMYVTRRGMNQAVESFNQQMSNLTTVLSTTRKHLTGRIDSVAKSVDESVRMQGELKKEVSTVHRVVQSVDGEVKNMRGDMHGLEGKIDSIQHTSVVAAQGVLLLCKVVTQGMSGRGTGVGWKQDLEHLSRLTSSAAAAGLGSSSASSLGSPTPGLGGLKDLPAFVAELESSTKLLTSGGSRSARHMIGMGITDASDYLGDVGGVPLVHRSTSASSRMHSSGAVGRRDPADCDLCESWGEMREHQEEGSRPSAGAAPGNRGRPSVQSARDHRDGGSSAQTGAQERRHSASTFTGDDMAFPPRTTAGAPALVAGMPPSRSHRTMPPVNFNL